MRQTTLPDQTAKLIELGFEKPKSSVECELPKGDWRIGQVGIRKAYSIGELIEVLPPHIGRWELDIFHNLRFECWVVCINPENHTTAATELVDALYDMCVKLKEEGVI